MPQRSIRIEYASSPYRLGIDDGIRLRVAVTCAEGLDSRIFAYRLMPATVNGSLGVFSHICSPVDMEEFPPQEPTIGQAPAWFRLAVVDVFTRSITTMSRLLQSIETDVRRLLASLAKMDTLRPGGVITVGDCTITPSDSSESVSDSDTPAPTYGDVQSVVVQATAAHGVGGLYPWEKIGTGAGSTLDVVNKSRVTLPLAGVSSLLLINGFDLSAIPTTAQIVGVSAAVRLKDASTGPASPKLTVFGLQMPELGASPHAGVDETIGSDWYETTYGGSDTLWGYAAIPRHALNDGAFGIGIVVVAGNPAVVEVDGASVEVFFREEV